MTKYYQRRPHPWRAGSMEVWDCCTEEEVVEAVRGNHSWEPDLLLF
ncbi:hypothetical protein F383_29308 [Gossypium arboreum]|uniref:Uncharacterized protein n=1 Tax=Gossypium arboreum TaxID=29729 RepID=A0A0B0PFZ8_GOSAR|nr:hypothetical protein F383_29308 [Gossypium arboreum]